MTSSLARTATRDPTAGMLAAPALALAAVVAATMLAPAPRLDAGLLAVTLLLCAAGSLVAVRAPRQRHDAFAPHQVVILWGAVLLPAWAIPLLAAAWLPAAVGGRRVPWRRAAFSAAGWTLAGVAAHAVTRAGGALEAGAAKPQTVAVLLAAAVAFVAVNRFLAALVAGVAGERPGERGRRGTGGALPLDVALAATGACLAALWAEAPELVVLAAGPAVLVHRALWVPVLLDKARTDAKTGLFNFDHFSTEFELALAEARKAAVPLAVAMMDLDHLRLVNNRAGHLAGDRLIRAVADIMSEEAGRGAIVGRFGGEEFALLLPGLTLADARELAERIRSRVEAIRLRGDDRLADLHITISAGVAAFPEHGDTTTALLSAADAALYDAKLGGRNRVRIALAEEAREALDRCGPAPAPASPPGAAAVPLASAGAGPPSPPASATVVSIPLPPTPPADDGGPVAVEDGGARTVPGPGKRPERATARQRWPRARRGGRLDPTSDRGAGSRRTPAELEAANRRLEVLLADSRGLLARMHRSYLATVTSLAATIEAKDPFTGGHTERVARLARGVAERLGFDEAQLRAIHVGAIIHDIGKVGVPDEILLKDGTLSSPEREAVRHHPEIASHLLAELELPPIVKQMVRSHHERYDGTGYPDGLTAEEIPLAARILTVVEALDAMTSDRPYRKALSLADARAELARKAGTQFCPRVVEAVIEHLDRDASLWPGVEAPATEHAAAG